MDSTISSALDSCWSMFPLGNFFWRQQSIAYHINAWHSRFLKKKLDFGGRVPGLLELFPCQIGWKQRPDSISKMVQFLAPFCGILHVQYLFPKKKLIHREASEAAGCIRRVPKYNETISQDLWHNTLSRHRWHRTVLGDRVVLFVMLLLRLHSGSFFLCRTLQYHIGPTKIFDFPIDMIQSSFASTSLVWNLSNTWRKTDFIFPWQWFTMVENSNWNKTQPLRSMIFSLEDMWNSNGKATQLKTDVFKLLIIVAKVQANIWCTESLHIWPFGLICFTAGFGLVVLYMINPFLLNVGVFQNFKPLGPLSPPETMWELKTRGHFDSWWGFWWISMIRDEFPLFLISSTHLRKLTWTPIMGWVWFRFDFSD